MWQDLLNSGQKPASFLSYWLNWCCIYSMLVIYESDFENPSYMFVVKWSWLIALDEHLVVDTRIHLLVSVHGKTIGHQHVNTSQPLAVNYRKLSGTWGYDKIWSPCIWQPQFWYVSEYTIPVNFFIPELLPQFWYIPELSKNSLPAACWMMPLVKYFATDIHLFISSQTRLSDTLWLST